MATESMPDTGEHTHAAQVTLEADPLTYEDAMSHPDAARVAHGYSTGQ